jgi:peptide chain release factor 1
MRLLSAKIVEEKRRKAEMEVASLRSSQVGSGIGLKGSEPTTSHRNRVTDHRIDLTLYKLDHVMNGAMDEITESLVKHFHQQELSGSQPIS